MKLGFYQSFSWAVLLIGTHALFLDESPVNSHELLVRQNTNAPQCILACETTNCDGACSAIRKRDLDPDLSAFALTSRDDNSTTTGSLEKRIFKILPENTGPDLGSFTVGQVQTYVSEQWRTNGEYDNQYGEMQYFFWDRNPGNTEQERGDERAFSRQATFGDRPFQFGQAALKGCTQVVLISRRAVWMAHFWESYSLGKPNTDGPRGNTGYTAFEQRVLNHLTGTRVTNPDPGYYPKTAPGWPENKDRPYITPEGPGIDKTLFTREDDPQLFIMSRARESDKPTTKAKEFRYPQRMKLISTAIAVHLGMRYITPTHFPYASVLDYPLTKAQQDAPNSRGMILFQYDPKSNGGNERRWRLFIEDTHRKSAPL